MSATMMGMESQKHPEHVYIVRWRSQSGPKSKVYLWPSAAWAFAARLAGWDTRDVVIWAAPCGPWSLAESEDA